MHARPTHTSIGSRHAPNAERGPCYDRWPKNAAKCSVCSSACWPCAMYIHTTWMAALVFCFCACCLCLYVGAYSPRNTVCRSLTYAVRLHNAETQSHIWHGVYEVTCMHLMFLGWQATMNRDPSRARLTYDFVGQEYTASMWHLACIAAVSWFFHAILVFISSEESACFNDSTRANLLDVRTSEREDAWRAQQNQALSDTAAPLLPLEEEDSTQRSVLPPCTEPVAILRWAEVPKPSSLQEVLFSKRRTPRPTTTAQDSSHMEEPGA